MYTTLYGLTDNGGMMALPGEGFSSPCEVPANFFVEQNGNYLVQGLIGSKFSMMLIFAI